MVTPLPAAEEPEVQKEDKIEYRDQDGNLLDPEQVAELEGKVSFQTKYETKTRLIDAAGNEIGDASAGAEGFAPPHPDVDREPETAPNQDEDDQRDYPATASPEQDVSNEKSIEKGKDGKPRPASEPKEATK
jgi:dolichyl-phosphate-mannose-protein mannosyltransferase